MNYKIGILGCGWLGLPLAKHLTTKYSRIKGTTTDSRKLEVIQHSGVDAFLIHIVNDVIKGNFGAFTRDLDTLIIAINAKNDGFYLKHMETLIKNIENTAIENIVYISTTSVYNDTNNVITEEHDVIEESIHVQAENMFRNHPKFNTTVVRFGGLIGEDRHPVYSLSGKKEIENPYAPINLIHKQDCIQLITKIIEQQKWNTVYNGVFPHHPLKKEYYTIQALERNLEPPTFQSLGISKGKVVSARKIENELNFEFKYSI